MCLRSLHKPSRVCLFYSEGNTRVERMLRENTLQGSEYYYRYYMGHETGNNYKPYSAFADARDNLVPILSRMSADQRATGLSFRSLYTFSDIFSSFFVLRDVKIVIFCGIILSANSNPSFLALFAGFHLCRRLSSRIFSE